MTTAENRTRSDSPRRRADAAGTGHTPRSGNARLGATDLPVLIRLPNLGQPRGKPALESKTESRTEAARAASSTRTASARTQVKSSSSKSPPAASPAPSSAIAKWGTIVWKAVVLAAAIALVALAYRIINGPATTVPLVPAQSPANVPEKDAPNLGRSPAPKFGAPPTLLTTPLAGTSPASGQPLESSVLPPAAAGSEPPGHSTEAADPGAMPSDQAPWTAWPQTAGAAASGEPAARVAARPREGQHFVDEPSAADSRRPWSTPRDDQARQPPAASADFQPYRHDAADGDPWSSSAQPIHVQTPVAADYGYGQRQAAEFEARRSPLERRHSPAPNTSRDYDYLETDPSTWRQPGDWDEQPTDAQVPANRPYQPQGSQPGDGAWNSSVRANVRDGGFRDAASPDGGFRGDYGPAGTARLQGIQQPPLR